MSNIAIDQILQVIPPARSAAEPVQPTVSDRPAFQDHLDRATNETLPSKSDKPIDTEPTDNNLTSTDRQQDAASSQEDETLAAADPAVTESGTKKEPESDKKTDPDAIELSDTAVALANDQVPVENEAGLAAEQSSPSDAENKNLVGSEETNAEGEGNADKTSGTQNAQPDESTSVEKSALPPEVAPTTETSNEPTSAEQPQQQGENQVPAGQVAEETKSQPKAEDKTQEVLAGEQAVALGKESKAAEVTASATQAEPAAAVSQVVEKSSAQQPQAAAETKVTKPAIPRDRKKAKSDSDPQPNVTKTESQRLQEEQIALTAENRPSIAASAPPTESTLPAPPVPSNLGGEATNFSLKPSGTPTAESSHAQTEGKPVSTTDRARFIRRVGGAIRSAQNRDGAIQLQLSPPELGTLRIEIVLKQGVLTAQLETETSAARAILLDNLPALRERLAGQEIRIEKFDVDVRDEGGSQSGNPGTEDGKTNRPPQVDRRQYQAKDERHQATPIPATLRTSSTPAGGLDVRI